MKKHTVNTELPGSFYQRNGRWWWSAKLPGDARAVSRPLRPVGASFATKDKAVAIEVAKLILEEAVRAGSDTSGRLRTIAQLVARYLEHCQTYYRPPSREAENVGYAVGPLVEMFPALPVEEFRPLRLEAVREAMVAKGWSRGVVNRRVEMIKRMFKWAVSKQLVPIVQYQELSTVEGLHRGRSAAKETKPIRPVKEDHVLLVLPYTTEVVATMVQIQLLTGMRSSEVCMMRPCDIDKSEPPVWFYRPQTHKTAYRGYSRLIPLGPKAQRLLTPYLLRDKTDYCFAPKESQEQRGSNGSHSRAVCKRYDKNSYRRAVQYAVKAANKDSVEVPMFTPHQLRHTAGTRTRKQFGADSAQSLLGHRHLRMTEHYAEIDKARAADVARKSG